MKKVSKEDELEVRKVAKELGIKDVDMIEDIESVGYKITKVLTNKDRQLTLSEIISISRIVNLKCFDLELSHDMIDDLMLKTIDYLDTTKEISKLIADTYDAQPRYTM